MVIDGVARRPGLVLAVCAWLAFASLTAVAVQEAVTFHRSFRERIFIASTGFGGLAIVCLVVAAMLVVVERMSSPVEESAVPVVAWVVLGSAVVALVMAAANAVILPTLATLTSASDWVAALCPSLTAGVLATLAALVAHRARR